jgi:hypothetical protein
MAAAVSDCESGGELPPPHALKANAATISSQDTICSFNPTLPPTRFDFLSQSNSKQYGILQAHVTAWHIHVKGPT